MSVGLSVLNQIVSYVWKWIQSRKDYKKYLSIWREALTICWWVVAKMITSYLRCSIRLRKEANWRTRAVHLRLFYFVFAHNDSQWQRRSAREEGRDMWGEATEDNHGKKWTEQKSGTAPTMNIPYVSLAILPIGTNKKTPLKSSWGIFLFWFGNIAAVFRWRERELEMIGSHHVTDADE